MNYLEEKAKNIRRSIVTSIYKSQTAHLSCSLSLVEILTILYFKHLNFEINNPKSEKRDYLILSKGHGCPALYATLAEVGFIEVDELANMKKLNSRLQGHPTVDKLPCIDFSTGSLGQGLSVSVGISLGIHLKHQSNKVFCILGDGELQEGQNWEAMMAAAKYKLSNLIAIVDRNRLQGDGFTENIMPLEDLAAKWESFGWDVREVDGHNFVELDSALTKTRNGPTVIIANTIKGKGISFAENQIDWHSLILNEDYYRRALTELDEVN